MVKYEFLLCNAIEPKPLKLVCSPQLMLLSYEVSIVLLSIDKIAFAIILVHILTKIVNTCVVVSTDQVL